MPWPGDERGQADHREAECPQPNPFLSALYQPKGGEVSQPADRQYLAGYEQGKKDALAESQQAPAGVVVVSKPGVPPKRATCGNCGAVCAYTSKAVKENTWLDLDGGSGGRHWITCASCGEDIVLKRW